jgi:thiamine-phosphate pyrophosphorylase
VSRERAAPAAREPARRLLLISPTYLDPASFAPRLEAALAAGGSAGFLLRLAGAERGEVSVAVAQLRPLCAAHGVAFLLQDDVELALELGADGVHLGAAGAVAATRAALGPERILGASCGRSRHAAMVAGDAGADYIAFGDPARPPTVELGELIVWWSELFVLPCLVESAATLTDCETLARVGADLIGVAAIVWQDPRGPAAAVADLRNAVVA